MSTPVNNESQGTSQRLILDGDEPEANEAILFDAVQHNKIAVVEQLVDAHIHLIDSKDKGKANLVCMAAQEGHLAVLELLLRKRADPNATDQSDTMWRRKALHHAAARGHVKIVQKLVECGADINIGDADSRTPLHWAATNGWVAVAEYLLKHGAAINLAQRDGFTPLHASTYLGHLTMCHFLLSQGADINSADRDGWTPLHAAVCYSHPEVVRLYLQSGADVNQKTRDQETALHIATDHGNQDILGDLLAYGAKLEEKNMDGFSPFFESVWRNKYAVSRYLIDMGADLNVRNTSGHSALLIATMRAAKNFMELIVAAGCNLQSETWIRQEQVPVALNEHRDLCEWLRHQSENPTSLQLLSSWAVRRQLGQNISAKAQELPIPNRLQDLVALNFL